MAHQVTFVRTSKNGNKKRYYYKACRESHPLSASSKNDAAQFNKEAAETVARHLRTMGLEDVAVVGE